MVLNTFSLKTEQFSEQPQTLFSEGELSAVAFAYSTGVAGLRLSNSNGHIIVLPFKGQQVWHAEFGGHPFTMKSQIPEPFLVNNGFEDGYGAFMLHCGLRAMGNPTKEDTHPQHGELPYTMYDAPELIVGEDEGGRYLELTGCFKHSAEGKADYSFTPQCRMYENSYGLETTVTIENTSDMPLEYFYLCHINWRPIDGAKLISPIKPGTVLVHKDVPENLPEYVLNAWNEYTDKVSSDPSVMDKVGAPGQCYDPEFVCTFKCTSDNDGWARTAQVLPDGWVHMVMHRPDELDTGVRWICRDAGLDAMGMILPATAEHKGYNYCKAHGQEKYLPAGEKKLIHLRVGILPPHEAENFLSDK